MTNFKLTAIALVGGLAIGGTALGVGAVVVKATDRAMANTMARTYAASTHFYEAEDLAIIPPAPREILPSPYEETEIAANE